MLAFPIFEHLESYDRATGNLNVIVETPRGTRNKYKYDEKYGVFKLDKILAAGHVFPFDFGYIPSTLAQDGDPVDVVLLHEEGTFTGCLVPSHVIGALTMEQKEKDGKVERNDRIIAIPAAALQHDQLTSIEQISDHYLQEIEHFFVSYNSMQGKQVIPIGRISSQKAQDLIEDGIKRYKQKNT